MDRTVFIGLQPTIVNLWLYHLAALLISPVFIRVMKTPRKDWQTVENESPFIHRRKTMTQCDWLIRASVDIIVFYHGYVSIWCSINLTQVFTNCNRAKTLTLVKKHRSSLNLRLSWLYISDNKGRYIWNDDFRREMK